MADPAAQLATDVIYFLTIETSMQKLSGISVLSLSMHLYVCADLIGIMKFGKFQVNVVRHVTARSFLFNFAYPDNNNKLRSHPALDDHGREEEDGGQRDGTDRRLYCDV